MRPSLCLAALLLVAAAPSAQTPIDWDDDASAHRGDALKLTLVCPPASASDRGRAVWGSNPYTDDSSICKAAVHAGAVGWDGGTVVIETRPGQDRYPASTRHGVATSSYGRWGGSFAVVEGAAEPPGAAPVGWDATATAYRGTSGRVTVTCPPAGDADRRRAVWGTDVYTDDSSVCRAAVHAGAIGWDGGTVTLEPRPGQASYRGTERNGVTSSAYGQWSGSFAVVSGATVAARQVDWDTDASALRGTSARVTVTCPPAGASDRSHPVWGTDVYTDDSGLCMAAVHAGAIGWSGGTVTVEPRAGQASYRGTTRNGVTSRDYGRWGGSFAVVR